MTETQNIHATTVDIDGRGVLICGKSGSGKSTLGLSLIGLGARLVADDQTFLETQNNVVLAKGATHLSGIIEARGVGFIRVPFIETTEIGLMIDMDQVEAHRLPQPEYRHILGIPIKTLRSTHGTGFAAAVFYLVKNGEVDL